MSILGHCQSGLGRITLHHDAGRFETRSTYTDATDGVTCRETVVPHSRAGAHEWFDLMEDRGAVLGAFPRRPARLRSGTKESAP